LTSCFPLNPDSYWWHELQHGLKYPNGVVVGKFCRPWYHYTHYRHLCKSQKCFDEYEEEYNNDVIRKGGRIDHIDEDRKVIHESCVKEARSNGDDIK
jgi:hypothetical protein